MRIEPLDAGAAERAESAERRGTGHFAFLALAPAAWCALLVLGLWIAPDERGYGTHERLGLPGCAAIDWLGVPCPGCGVTTSVTLAVQGHPLAAAATQPLGLLVVLALALYPLWALRVHLAGGDLSIAVAERTTTRRATTLLLLILLAWGYKLVVTP